MKFSFLENNLYALLFLKWIVNVIGINTGAEVPVTLAADGRRGTLPDSTLPGETSAHTGWRQRVTKITQKRHKAQMPVPAESHYQGQRRLWAWAEASSPLSASCSWLKSKAAGSHATCPEFGLNRMAGLPPCSPTPKSPFGPPRLSSGPQAEPRTIRELLARMETPVDVSCAYHFCVPRTVLKASDVSPHYCDSYLTSEEAQIPRMSRNMSQITQPV